MTQVPPSGPKCCRQVASPESGPLFYESGLPSGYSHVRLFVALFQEDLSLQNANPLVVSESEEGLRCSLLCPIQKQSGKLCGNFVETFKSMTETYLTWAMEMRSSLEATLPANSSMVRPGASTTRRDVPTIEMLAIFLQFVLTKL